MKTAIDLGYTYDNGPCAPCEVKSQTDAPKKHYPCLHIDCGSSLLKNLPDEGEVTIRFKVTSRNTNERDGKKTCSLTLEAREILDVDVESEDEEESGESALDKLAKLESAKED
jgi:hypothetical protein